MSVKALNAAFEHSRADGAAFIVLVALADWADQNGRCYPSFAQIAKKARVSRASAAVAIQRLIALGELQRDRKGHAPDAHDDEAPANVRAQWRNSYRITVRKLEVVQRSDDQPTAEVVQRLDRSVVQSVTNPVVQPLDYQGPNAAPLGPLREVVQPLDGLAVASDGRGSPINAAQVVQSDRSHKRIRPSGEPSVEIQAGGCAPDVPENADANVGVITKLAHETLDLWPRLEDGDLAEVVKGRCARLRIAYDARTIAKAVDSARWQRAHAAPAEV